MIRSRLSLLFLVFVALSALLACGGSSTQTPPPKAVTDVYAAGFEKNDAGDMVAKYWKNGQAFTLGGTNGSYASAIAVSGSDVYVGGIEWNGTVDVAKYWKNGVAVDLTDGTKESHVHSIFVHGNDLYVAGDELEPGFTTAKYWKNGVPVVLADGQSAWSIVVRGSDIYAAGYRYKTTQIDPTHYVTNHVAMYWKNGVPTELTDGLTPAVALSIFVTETNDVYVSGWACKTMDPGCALATYWKNGVPVQVTGTTNSDVVSLAVVGGDVYAAGNQDNSEAQLWKNGVLIPLSNSSAGSGANQLVAAGGDIYVAGGMLNNAGLGVATYWKNGTPFSLTNGTHFASAYAVAVVKH